MLVLARVSIIICSLSVRFSPATIRYTVLLFKYVSFLIEWYMYVSMKHSRMYELAPPPIRQQRSLLFGTDDHVVMAIPRTIS
jgi:hypothetical protein